MTSVYRMALSKPYVESIAWNDLADLQPTLPNGGLVDEMLKPKIGFTRLQELREQFKAYGRK